MPEVTVPGAIKPEISDVKVEAINNTGYTVSFATKGVSKVQLPTWTVKNGQADIKYYTTEPINNRVSYRINTADFNHEIGGYITHIYASNESGDQVAYAVPEVTIP